jgi:hypothetical protein
MKFHIAHKSLSCCCTPLVQWISWATGWLAPTLMSSRPSSDEIHNYIISPKFPILAISRFSRFPSYSHMSIETNRWRANTRNTKPQKKKKLISFNLISKFKNLKDQQWTGMDFSVDSGS